MPRRSSDSNARRTTSRGSSATAARVRTPSSARAAPRAAGNQPADLPPSRALEHGGNAFGVRYLRRGFAHTADLDLAYALGRGAPNIEPTRLLPDLPAGKPVKYGNPGIARNVAIAGLRAGTLPTVAEANPPAIDESEAQQLVREHLATLELPPVFWGALEGLAGPACVLPAYVDGLEAIADEDWDTGLLTGLLALVYGLLLRAPVDVSTAARGRLEQLHARRKDQFAAAQLEIVLHGARGIAACGYKYSAEYKSFRRNASADPSNVTDLCFCDGDAAFVASQFAALWRAFGYRTIAHMSGPSPPRLFFLGGEAALEVELLVVDRYLGTKQAAALASYADLSSPLAIELVRRLARPGSKVKAKAETWLREHGHRA